MSYTHNGNIHPKHIHVYTIDDKLYIMVHMLQIHAVGQDGKSSPLEQVHTIETTCELNHHKY